jgi:hypothetical protein
MFTGIRWLRALVSRSCVAVVSFASDAAPQSPTYQLKLSPQDTSLNLDATNYSAQSLLTAYTWPDNRVANAILLKFDLSTLPAGATVEEAVLKLALVETDATADTTYTMTAHKLVGRTPSSPRPLHRWRNAVDAERRRYNGVPLAQSVSSPYAVWLSTRHPASRPGRSPRCSGNGSPPHVQLRPRVVPTRRWRVIQHSSSLKHADPTLWPMEITDPLPGDTTPPVISGAPRPSRACRRRLAGRPTRRPTRRSSTD